MFVCDWVCFFVCVSLTVCGHLPRRFFKLTWFSTFESDPSLGRHGNRAPLCCLAVAAPTHLPRSTTHNALLLCQEVPERPGGRGRLHWCCPGDRGGRRLVSDYKGVLTKKKSAHQFTSTLSYVHILYLGSVSQHH